MSEILKLVRDFYVHATSWNMGDDPEPHVARARKVQAAEWDRAIAEIERAAAENAVEEFRQAMLTALTAPDPELSQTFGGQEYLATSIIEVLISGQGNPYRRNEGEGA